MAGTTAERTEIDSRTQVLHGRKLAFRVGGEGPTILLIHGITGDSDVWASALPRLVGAGHQVIAPDMPGHGASERQRGDHSLGAHASMLRDLLMTIDSQPVSVVGHSLGGGMAMQFAYQFPELVERLVLVDSGGLGREVSPLIRAALLPGAERFLGLANADEVRGAVSALGRFFDRIGLKPGSDISEALRGVGSLQDADRRAAFVRTARSVISLAGQRVSANDKLYLAQHVPTLIIWGERDKLIPVDHAHDAHKAMPGSRLELFEDAGHFPMLDDPERFASLLSNFIATTEPAVNDRDELRRRLLEGDGTRRRLNP
ncbi:MAG: alpha/beta fold hydrolase [Solirubrobacterales bacterium]